MFFRILKNDLKRKRSMNLILMLFIVLAATFLASGLSNVITVTGGTDYYLKNAGIKDYSIITSGTNSMGHIKEVFEGKEGITSLKIEKVVFGSKDITLGNGETAETKNTTIFQSIDGIGLNYYDINNKPVKEVQKGHVYAGGKFMEKNNLNVGDKIKVSLSEVEMELILDGKVKDALLGSDFMGNSRFFLNEEDFETLEQDPLLNRFNRGEIAYVSATDSKIVEEALSDVPGIAFSGKYSTIKMAYVMETIVAFMVLVLSLCLIIVSFTVLKFSISMSIQEEFREIGVMKAIGINNVSIRGLYMVKYLLMAVIGSTIGFFLSLPFGKLLLNSVNSNMVLGNTYGLILNAFGAVLVIAAIVAFAYSCTGKVKKSSPIDAIRSGQTGERYKQKTIYRIGKSHVGTNLYMALNDIVSSPKRFATIILSFSLCTLFVLMLVNTTETFNSPNLIDTFGLKSDIYVNNVKQAMINSMGTKEEYIETLNHEAEELTEKGIPVKAHAEVQYKYLVSFEGKEYKVTFQQGVNTKAEDYIYTKGTAPRNGYEVAITEQISNMIGATIGDVITIDFGTEKRECMVTAYFQTMNQLGEIIRLHEEAPTDFTYVASILQKQFSYTDEPDSKEIKVRKEKIAEIYSDSEVMDATEYCIDCTGVKDTLTAVQYLMLAITIIVVVLVTVLMERSFITDEKSQIAILKAIGFRQKDIISWQTLRFGTIALTSVLLAAAVSIPMTKLCITPIFGMMGAKKIDYNIVVWKIFGLYPVIILIVTLIVAFMASLYTNKITSRDTANIE